MPDETCEACGGHVKIIACIEDPDVIQRILGRLDRDPAPRPVPSMRIPCARRRNCPCPGSTTELGPPMHARMPSLASDGRGGARLHRRAIGICYRFHPIKRPDFVSLNPALTRIHQI